IVMPATSALPRRLAGQASDVQDSVGVDDKRLSPWRLGGLTPWQLASRVWREYGEDEISDRAASLSYYFLFALFPSLLFLTALLGMLPIPDLMAQLIGYVDQTMPGDAASVLRKTLMEIQRGSR